MAVAGSEAVFFVVLLLLGPLVCATIAQARGMEWWIGALLGLLGCVGLVILLVMKPKPSDPLPPPPPGAQWAADPLRRHELRLWDGSRWTGHVSDFGAAGWDPLADDRPPLG